MGKSDKRPARRRQDLELDVLALLLEVSLLTHKICGRPDVGADEARRAGRKPVAKRRPRR